MRILPTTIVHTSCRVDCGSRGETEPKSNYDWSTYFDSVDGSSSNFDKYAANKKTTLDEEDDVAHVKWGGEWRLPNSAELGELCSKCTWTWESRNGVNGYKVTGTNGNSIFLPAAGHRNDSSLDLAGSDGYYWSSSLSGYDSCSAYELYFDSSYVSRYGSNRYYGQSVRAVCP